MFLQRQAPSTASAVVPPPPQPSWAAWLSTPLKQVVCSKRSVVRGEKAWRLMGRRQLTPQVGKLSGGGNNTAAARLAEMAARTMEVFIFGEVEDGVVMGLYVYLSRAVRICCS